MQSIAIVGGYMPSRLSVALGLVAHTSKVVVWQLVVLLDVLVNLLFNGNKETVSARAGKARDRGRAWGCTLCRWLDSIDPGHCDEAVKDPMGPLD